MVHIRFIILLSILASLFLTNNVYSNNTFKGADLLAACRFTLQQYDGKIDTSDATFEQLPETFKCSYYIDGFHDSLKVNEIALKRFNKPNHPLICINSTISTLQLIRVVVKFIEKNPTLLHYNSDVLIWIALNEAFPCTYANTIEQIISSETTESPSQTGK